MNTCKVPMPVDDGDGDNRWLSIHNRFLSESKEKDADVIFIGDSIVQALQHTDVWNELFVPLHCLNFGIHRDKIENVLWRIQNGELDNVKPKIIVLHVGTNNYSNTPEEIRDGIVELVEIIKEKHPDVYIVVPTLLPRGQNPNTVRDKLAKVNELLKPALEGRPKVEMVVIDNGFVRADGTISHHDMYDYLLLTNSGCKKAFEPVHELLMQLLADGEIENDLTPSE
ncbi:platelet-activating factor acetylhydrolase IB subunit beta homolog [Diorhabda carinulata]|uniref:platelet-activating factor acetylhydrolase IB subunit beta homolog n=1 Tax=Diorhabda carinulata TaxID=1163345 RepID=UPI0025A05B5D|nr:platelet-activating factor acetylhydrolase IB subunit beta homolog [Diorhabda carinulata]